MIAIELQGYDQCLKDLMKQKSQHYLELPVIYIMHTYSFVLVLMVCL